MIRQWYIVFVLLIHSYTMTMKQHDEHLVIASGQAIGYMRYEDTGRGYPKRYSVLDLSKEVVAIFDIHKDHVWFKFITDNEQKKDNVFKVVRERKPELKKFVDDFIVREKNKREKNN